MELSLCSCCPCWTTSCVCLLDNFSFGTLHTCRWMPWVNSANYVLVTLSCREFRPSSIVAQSGDGGAMHDGNLCENYLSDLYIKLAGRCQGIPSHILPSLRWMSVYLADICRLCCNCLGSHPVCLRQIPTTWWRPFERIHMRPYAPLCMNDRIERD